MAVVHGEWCGAKTRPISCPTCAASVFYFSCGHGSKVFFDELGSPWPIHDCEESWARNLKRYTAENGDTVVELKPGITVTRSFARPGSFKVDQSFLSKARPLTKARTPDPIVRIEPARDLSESHVGILREIRPSVDPVRDFGVADTAMGRALLGSIGKQEMGKITVHVPYLEEDFYTESFTTWIPAKILRDRRVKRGAKVALDLESIRIVGHGYAWFCGSLEVVR